MLRPKATILCIDDHWNGLIGRKMLLEENGYKVLEATGGLEGIKLFLAHPVDAVVDTTGAGDAFHGGFIYGLLAGFSAEETLKFANAVAGLKCRAIGARTALPSLDEVNALLSATASA